MALDKSGRPVAQCGKPQPWRTLSAGKNASAMRFFHEAEAIGAPLPWRTSTPLSYKASRHRRRERRDRTSTQSAQIADANGIIVPGSGAAAEGGAGSTLMEMPA